MTATIHTLPQPAPPAPPYAVGDRVILPGGAHGLVDNVRLVERHPQFWLMTVTRFDGGGREFHHKDTLRLAPGAA